MNIRLATPIEAGILTDLAVSSEAYWEFGEKYLVTFREQYSLTEEYIENTNVLILEDTLNILGFFSLEADSNLLNHFYISHKFIGHGYGKLMWDFLISYCKEKSIKSFSLVATPEVLNFYTKLGAKVIKIVKSNLNNRDIFLLEYQL